MAGALLRHTYVDEGADPALLQTPGAFAWWYADMVNEEGDGLVLIWSFGLPFLPGVRKAPVAPQQWPALNVALYRRGRPAWFQLQRFHPDNVDNLAEEGLWRFGATTITRRVEVGALCLDVSLDCRTPSSHLTGTVQLKGPRTLAPSDLSFHDEASTLDWSVLTACAQSDVDLHVDGTPVRWSGRGYHDHNNGLRPLWELGVRHWWWGRIPFENEERIYFVLEPLQRQEPTQATGVMLDAEGTMRTCALSVQSSAIERSAWGLPVPRHLKLFAPNGHLFADLTERARPESSPFYARSLVQAAREDGQQGLGFAEMVAPQRLDRAWMRPLVRMRVQEPLGSSRWLPMFSGAGPLARLAAGRSSL